MRDTTRKIATGLALSLALALGRGAVAQDDDAYGDGYQEGDYGRIRYADGGASILRADGQTEGGARAGLNAPIFPGDTLRTDANQRVEVQLASGTLVRLDRGTSVAFQSMPDPYAKFQDNTVLVLQAGAVRVAARLADKEEFRVDTESGAVYLLGEGDFRIESDGRGHTTVSSLRGVAEVVGSQGSVLVRGGSRTTVATGYTPEDPRAYSAYASDGFDRWCETRDAAYRDAGDTAVAQNDVPYEVQPYYRELSSYGTWVTVPDYGRVWYPSGAYAGWRPYYDGYWAYGPGGYFWVSYEPWGWAPYRYGNWQWVGTYGWCWVPGHVFAGAWVSWSWGSAYLGWAPLDYWGHPCYRYGGYRYGYYDPDCWTFVNYTNVHVTDVRRHAVPVSRVGDDLRTARLTTRPARIAPSRIAASPEARARAIREVAQDRAAAIRPGGSSRKLGDVAQESLRRVPRTGERTAVRPSERFPRRTLEDTRPARPQTMAPRGNERTIQRRDDAVQPARPQVRGNERTTDRRSFDSSQPARPQVRDNERTIDRRSVDSAQPARPQVRGNERTIDRRSVDSAQPARPQVRGNERTVDRRSVDSSQPARPQVRGNERTAPRRDTDAVQPERPQPRASEPGARTNVRELYERMSKPRETRPPSARPQTQAQAPRSQPQAQRSQPQRSQPQAQRSQPQRSPSPKSGGGQKAQPRGGGQGNKKH
jgi:uncharacterized protein DUF6600/FecR-like protein